MHDQDSQSAVTQLHAVVERIAGRISDVRNIIDRFGDTAIGLYHIDLHMACSEEDPEPNYPERSQFWRPILAELRELVAVAIRQWSPQPGSTSSPPALALTAASEATASCGPMTRNSYHELVIDIGRVICFPDEDGILHSNELGIMLNYADMSAKRAQSVARLRITKELASREWWDAVRLGLDREHARAISSPAAKSFVGATRDNISSEVVQTFELANNLQRAFDLLRHCQNAVHANANPNDPDNTKSLTQLEDVLRRWLPCTVESESPTLEAAALALGDFKALSTLLQDLDLAGELSNELTRLAERFTGSLDTATALLRACPIAITEWRRLQPGVAVNADGGQKSIKADPSLATAERGLWSADQSKILSWRGASLIVAELCDALARLGAGVGLPLERLRPALRFAQLLRQHPDWTDLRGDTVDAPSIVDEQRRLASEVELIVAEVELADHQAQTVPAGTIPHAGQAGPIARLTGKEAAMMVGVNPSTLSRWHKQTPAWATEEIRLFQDLLDRDRGKYRREKMLRLQRWFEIANADGGHRPVRCP